MLDHEMHLAEGLRFQKLGMLEQALEHYDVAAKSSTDPAQVSEALRREALVYRAWCKWDKAVEAARQSATIAHTAKLDELYAEALNAEAIVHQERGEFDEAIALLRKSLASAATHRLRGITYQNMGSIAAQRADLAAAADCYRKSYRFFRRAKYQWGEAFALNNYAAVALDLGNLKLAEVVAGQAMAAARRVGDLELLGIAAMNSAEALAAQGRLDEAERLAVAALDYFVVEENNLRRAQCLRVIGDLKILRGERTAARPAYLQALQLAESVGSELESSRIRDCLELTEPSS